MEQALAEMHLDMFGQAGTLSKGTPTLLEQKGH